jgi:rare lipoprotein A
MGYQDESVKTVTVDLAFDAVMLRNDGLTQDSILASFKRRQTAKSTSR